MGMNLAGLLNMLRRFRSSVSNRHIYIYIYVPGKPSALFLRQ